MKFFRAFTKALWHAFIFFIRFIVYFSFFLAALAERGLEAVRLWPAVWPFRSYRRPVKK